MDSNEISIVTAEFKAISDLKLVWLLEKDGSSDKAKLLKVIKDNNIDDGSVTDFSPDARDVLETLDDYKSNINNLVTCFQKFKIDDYNKDVIKQSNKFILRLKDIFEGLNEFGERFDLSRAHILCKTELKMLDIDRNKIFNICMDVIGKAAHMQAGAASDNTPTANTMDQRRSHAQPNSDQKRESKKNVDLPDESNYSGEWLNGEPDGKGRRNWPDREADSPLKSSKYPLQYEGDFRAGRAHGFGKWHFANGDIYEGEWENEEKHGMGKQENKKGVVLSGRWVNGSLEGKGVEIWPNGDHFEGDFALGKKHGNGVFKFNDGSVYTGEFKENSINGFGTYVWNDGRSFEGYFKGNKMEGFGKYIWPQGEIYEGEYKNDKRHGKGKFSWPDGRLYDGYFQDGKKHGDATYTDKKGEKRKGVWENGKHVKWI